MSPELTKAIKERKDLGYSEEKIKQELMAAGYENDEILAVLELSDNDHTTNLDLPKVTTLINQSLAFVKERYDLLLVLASPLIVVSLVDYLQNEELVSDGLLVLAGLVSVLSLVAYYVLSLAVLYVVAHHDDREVSFKDALSWSGQNIFKYAWIAILSTLIIWGGLILLIIPGLIFSIYFYLAQYVFVMEGKTGFTALARSQQMVSGVWWPLVTRLIGIWLVFFVFFMFFGLLFGLATISLMGNEVALFLVEVMFQFLAAGVTVCTLHIAGQIYQNRQKQVIDNQVKPKYGLYGTFVALGIFLIPLIIVSVMLLADQVDQERMLNNASGLDQEELLDAKNRAQEIRNVEEPSAI